MVDGERHYLTVWIRTWRRESDLEGARELIDELESALLEEGQQEMDKSKLSDEGEPKKRRGRPALETTDLEEPQGRTPEGWEIDFFAARKMVNGERYYLTVWRATWMPESDLDGARELIDKFESGLLEEGQQEIDKSKSSDEGESKKRRGRPPKRRC
jgi:hypothetical protein